MNQVANTAVAQSTRSAERQPLRMPRRQRLGSAIASAIVSGVLFGSVVLGMTSMGDDGPQFVAQARTSAPA